MLPLIKALVNTAVVTDNQVIGILRVKSHRMVIHVLVVAGHLGEVFAAVIGEMQEHIRLVDPIEIVGAGKQLLVIVGAGAAG